MALSSDIRLFGTTGDSFNYFLSFCPYVGKPVNLNLTLGSCLIDVSATASATATTRKCYENP